MVVDLQGRVAVVTGAAGALGRAYSLELARLGAAVVVNDTPESQEDTEELVAAIDRLGGRATVSFDSVATEEGGAAIIATALDRFGPVDAVVHNAGVWRHQFFDDMTAQQLDPVLDVHLRGAFFVTRPAWPIMKEKGYGRIVLTSSGAGAFGREKGSNYVASKAGVLGLVRALSIEGSRFGIHSNAILPIAPFDRRRPGPPEVVKQLLASGLPPDSGPDLVAPMVAFLASEACHVSGEAYSAGGGRFARVFTGVTSGWLAQPGTPPSVDDIDANLPSIRDLGSFAVPESVWDELMEIGLAQKRSRHQN